MTYVQDNQVRKPRIALRAAWIVLGLLAMPVACPAGENIAMAVFTFDNLTGSSKHDWVGTGFAEALTRKLQNVDRLVIRDRREVSDISRVAQIDQRKVNEKDAEELGRLTGCDYLIFGAVQAAGDIDRKGAPLRATARLVEVRTGRVGKAIQLDGRMTELFELQDRLALAFVNLLGLELSVVAENAIRQHGTDSLLAYKLYCEGLALLDQERYDEAMSKFREANSKHPGILYAEAHHALGTAYLRSGRTKEMLKEFEQDTQALSPVWFDLGVAYERAGQLDKAAEAFQTFVKYTGRRFSPWRYGGNVSLSASGEDAANVLLADPEGYFHCLDGKSGRLRWRKDFPPPSRPVTLAEEYAYFGTEDGTLYQVNALTGEMGWQVKLGAALAAPVQVVPGAKCIVAATVHGEVVAFAQDDGAIQWRKRLDTIATGMTSRESVLYLGDNAGTVYAMESQDGAIRWQRVAPAPVRRASVANSEIHVATTGGHLLGLDAATGKETWSYTHVDPDSPLTLSADGDAVRRADGALAWIGPGGRETWVYKSETPLRHVVPVGSRVIVSDGGRDLVVLDRADGRVVERRSLPAKVREMSRAGDLLLVRTVDDSVHAFGFARTRNDPDDRAGYLRLAEVFERSGRTAEAVQTYELLLGSLDPSCAQAMYALARLYQQQGRNDLAQAMLQRQRTMTQSSGDSETEERTP